MQSGIYTRCRLIICKLALTAIFSLLLFNKATASHLYGADLFYTHVSGTTYEITLVVYGDCGGAAFPSFPTSSAAVQVFNGSSTFTTLTLSLQNPTSGVEVTPVCPSQINNTTCNSGSIPGVKKFVYSRQITLGTTSANWRFRFTGNLGNTSAGRSNNISNIVQGTNGSIMNLEATLNNTSGPNSSPTYTTIPTPFFCINKAASYNPGAIDPNGDSISYALVPGLEQSTNVTYATGFSATAPLAAATGTFNFSIQNGQLNFTPNLVQQALVVNRVSEYKNGVLVGTSMREMTFVVLNNCANNPPGGKITNNNTGKVSTDSTSIQACKSAGNLSFNINAADLDNDTMDISFSGLPAGATFSFANNGSTSPVGTFSWNLTTATPGTYTFFITYIDRGCPLSSKQTVAYSIKILPEPVVDINITSPATCVKKAVFTMTPSVSPSPWTLQVIQGSSVLHNFTGVTSSQTDSLSPGTYMVRVYNADTCFKDTQLVIDPPPVLGINLAVTPLKCHNDTNAVVVVIGTGGKSPFLYAGGASSFSTADTFKNLSAGLYQFKVKDDNECIKDTIIQIANPGKVDADITIQQPPCNFFNSGVITISGKNAVSPYLYKFNNGSFDTTRTYSGLYSGSYPVIVKDANDCTLDTTVILPDSVKVTATALITHILCNGDSTGEITLNASGASPPYKYQLVGVTALTPNNQFTNLPAKTHQFHIEDTNRCYLDTLIPVNQPLAVEASASVTDVLCNGDNTGTITANGGGGVSPYTYAINTGSYNTSPSFTSLPAGTHIIHVKDMNGCEKDTAITIKEPTVLSFSNIQITNPLCFGALTGQVVTTGTGGVKPYEYAVGTGAFSSSNSFGGLGAGTTLFYVRDSNNCIADSAVAITQPARIVPSASVKRSTCAPLDDGRITLGASGGVPGYRYALGTGAYSTSSVFSPLSAGTYLLHVRDVNNCIIDTTIKVGDSITVTANYSIIDANCYDSSTGIINISASGGILPYTYAINSGTFGPSPAFGGLGAGSYNIMIKDDLGCIKDTTLDIDEPNRIVPTLTFSEPTCYDYKDGQITVFATGGTSPYTFAVNNGGFLPFGNFSGISAGTNVVRTKDINGCIIDTTINIGQPAGIFFEIDVTNLTCHGDSSGAVKIKGSGGIAPYTYTFNQQPYTTLDTLSGIPAGRNIIKMKDNNGCIIDSEIVFTEPADLLLVNPILTDPTCEGFHDGEIEVYGNGGVKPYRFSIDNIIFSTGNSFDSLPEGNHTIFIKDANDCLHFTRYNLQGHPHILYDVVPDAVSCFEGSDGALTVNNTTGTAPFKYSIDGGTIKDGAFFDSLKGGAHTISVTDSFGCIKDSNIVLDEPQKINIETKASPNDCDGIDDGGRVEVIASGGTPGYEYLWNTNPERRGYIIEGVANGSYWVTVTDANGCIDSAKADIEYDNCCIVFVPDAFTPNNDGLNDKAKVLVKGDFELEIFAIFNRFGERVFMTKDITQGWDGTYKSKQQDLGTYNYYVKGVCGNAGRKDVMYKGTIILVK